jgi:hypothetical protein
MLCLSPCVCHCICLGHAVCTTVSVGHFGSFFCFSCRMFMSLSHSSVTEIANHQGTGVCVKLQRLRADCHQALQQNQFLMQYITNGSQQFMAPAAATPLTRVAGTEPCRFSVFSVSEALPICVVRLIHASDIVCLPLGVFYSSWLLVRGSSRECNDNCKCLEYREGAARQNEHCHLHHSHLFRLFR